MRHLRTLASGALALALVASANAQPVSTAPTVTISSGRLDGLRLASGVTAYLGVPYAAPPVRELRWRDPQPPASWPGVYHADRFGPQCVQPQRGVLTNQYSGAEITSENCLYLNVWTRPSLRKAPVIVYLHGGGFFIGSASMPLYGGEGVAQRGAVFVNLNYRLGALGFLSHPELSAESPHKTSGDYAFLDQIAALEWVRDNIAAFGGDPDNVTIAGQSAGSMSVLTLQASPRAKGLFHRAVGMSGSMLGSGPFRLRSLADAEREGVKFQEVVKAKNLDDLRAMPADRLGVPRTPGGPSIGPIQDGYVLSEDLDTVFARGGQSDVPLLLGFAQDESLGGIGEIKDLADYKAKASARFGLRADTFLELYPASNDEEARARAREADRDATMVASMSAWARAQARSGRAPVFSYMFARPHTYAPGVRITDLNPAAAGSYHTSEVPFWLGSLESFNQFRRTRAWTKADQDFSLAMTDALVAFARTGNPATAKLDWPRFDPARPMLLELGQTARPSAWPEQRKLDFFATATAPASASAAAGGLRD